MYNNYAAVPSNTRPKVNNVNAPDDVLAPKIETSNCPNIKLKAAPIRMIPEYLSYKTPSGSIKKILIKLGIE